MTPQEGIITRIERVESSPTTEVYDIGVAIHHNFFAGNTLVHNCHHVSSESYTQLFINCPNAYYRVGVSATPWRDGGDDILIEAGLSKRNPEHNITASFLIDEGYLVPVTIYMVPHKQVFKGQNYQKLYKEAIVLNEQRNADIVHLACKMRETRDATVLILIKEIGHGEALLAALTAALPEETFTVSVTDSVSGKSTLMRVKSVEFLSGKDDQLRRKAVLQAVRERRCRVLIGSTIADEGLDVSSLDTLILAGGGKSSTRAFQRIGRVLRLHEERDEQGQVTYRKSRAVVFDFDDATPILKRHARIRQKLYHSEPRWEIKQLNPQLLR